MGRRQLDEVVERARFAVSEVTRARVANKRSQGNCPDDARAQRLRDIGWDDRADEFASDDALWRR